MRTLLFVFFGFLGGFFTSAVFFTSIKLHVSNEIKILRDDLQKLLTRIGTY